MAVRQSMSLSEEDQFVFAQAGKTQFSYPATEEKSLNTTKEPRPYPLIRDSGERDHFAAGMQLGADSKVGMAGEESAEVAQSELVLRTEEVGGGLQTVLKPSYEQIWQAHDAYLICPLRDALLVVDQQAAHQRVLYEEACKNMAESKQEIQQLLFPFVLKLGREEFSMAQDLLGDLLAIGFDMREFGENTFVIDGVPGDLENWNEGAVLRRVLADLIAEKKNSAEQMREMLLVSYARHAAVTEGRTLDLREMRSIVVRLMQCSEPYVCPRGKPTMVKVMRRDLDRLFGKA